MNAYLKLALSRAALLALAVALAVPARPALASQISCGAILTKDTKLDSDLTNCPGDGLVIGADHITVTLNGHSISGTGAPGSAGIRNRGHNQVEHNQAATEESDGNACFGIVLRDGSDDNQVRANLASQNRGSAGDGIFISAGSRKNRITDNLATFNSDDGIDVDEPATTIAN